MENQLDLPIELEPHREKIMSSLRLYIHISTEKENKEIQPWASKIGGAPYLPKGMEIPTGENGNPLYLLAQINFSEVPELPPFPTKGLLQFFISDNDLYGMDLKNPATQNNFRIRYFGEIDEHIPLVNFTENYSEDIMVPFKPNEVYPLTFEIKDEAVPLSDYRINDFLGDDFFTQFGNRKWEVMEAYSNKINSAGHRLGGYSFFTQNEPRGNEIEPMMQLLQIDTDEKINCFWGDMGVAHFFIKQEALENLDFSEVAYWWDCY